MLSVGYSVQWQSRTMVKPVVIHKSTHCDRGMILCGTKLTDKNRVSMDGWNFCRGCYEKEKKKFVDNPETS